jgi:hypothetical protein
MTASDAHCASAAEEQLQQHDRVERKRDFQRQIRARIAALVALEDEVTGKEKEEKSAVALAPSLSWAHSPLGGRGQHSPLIFRTAGCRVQMNEPLRTRPKCVTMNGWVKHGSTDAATNVTYSRPSGRSTSSQEKELSRSVARGQTRRRAWWVASWHATPPWVTQRAAANRRSATWNQLQKTTMLEGGGEERHQ